MPVNEMLKSRDYALLKIKVKSENHNHISSPGMQWVSPSRVQINIIQIFKFVTPISRLLHWKPDAESEFNS